MKPTAEETVNTVTDFLNTFSFNENSDKFIHHMNVEHRTLQQNFTRLCLRWLENCASDEYRHDLRNKGSHDISKQLVDKFKEDNGKFNPSDFLSHI
jgi:hypothetical protein